MEENLNHTLEDEAKWGLITPQRFPSVPPYKEIERKKKKSIEGMPLKVKTSKYVHVNFFPTSRS